MFPGAHPFESLQVALLRVAVNRPPHLYDELTSDADGLRRVVEQIAESGDTEIILVIDQFEELFSMVASAPDRQRFLDALVAATGDGSRLRVVLTLRADFFDQPLQYPEFAELFSSNVVPINPPTRDGLARAISQPARRVGVGLEPGLVSRIVDDVREQPGGLPLLQFALTELFARRDGDLLTVAGYEASGGVERALANRAEDTYAGLSAQGKEAARQLFLRLVTVDELADDTRRRVRQSELLGLDVDRAVMSDTLQRFGSLRFLSFDRDIASRAPTVELAHEALLREWQRLRTWIDERREDLLIHRRVQLTVHDWQDSGEDPSYLLRGNRLEQAIAWADRTDIAISEIEVGLIEASLGAEQREQADREALESKATRRRKAMIGVLAGGLVVAGLLGTVALERARDARVTAAQATARDLSTSAVAVIEEDPELGILLSLEAIEATDAVGAERVPEAASALRSTLAATRVLSRLPTGYGAVAFSGDGNRLVTDETDHRTLLLWDLASQTELARWVAPGGSGPVGIGQVAFTADGASLASTWVYVGEQLPLEGWTMHAVTLHDPETLDLVMSLPGEDGAYWAPSFGAVGLVAATFRGEDHSGVYVWDRESGQVIERFVSDPGTIGGMFIPDTTTLVLAQSGVRDSAGELVEPGLVRAIDVTTSDELWALPPLGINPSFMAVSPDGSKLALADNNLMEIWDLNTREQIHEGQHPDPQQITWSLDGSRLALSGNDSRVTILDAQRDWTPLIVGGHKASVWGTAIHPNGETLASASEDGEVVISDITEAGAVGDEAVAVGSPVGLLFLGPENRLVAGRDNGGGVTMDSVSGEVLADLPIEQSFALMPNDDFTTVAGPGSQGTDGLSFGVLVDAISGAVTHTFPECMIPRATSSGDEFVVLDSVDVCDPNDTLVPSQVLDLDSGAMVIDLGKRAILKAVFSPEGFDGPRYVAVTPYGEALEIYSLDDHELVASYSMDELRITGLGPLAVDPTGKYLGFGTIGPSSIVIDMTAIMSGASKMDAVLFNIEGNTATSPQFRVTSDGIGASASFNPVYRVWDINARELLFEINVDGLDDLGAVQFTPDGQQLAYEAANGVIRFTPLDTQAVIERARATVTRSLTDDECRQYLHTDGCVDSPGD
jgi:WD40 repeat protein